MDSRSRRRPDETTVRVRAFVAPDEDDEDEVPLIRVLMRPMPTTVVAPPFQLQVAIDDPTSRRRS